MRIRAIGVDEAGYGPNLGPLVMSAVMVESIEPGPVIVWDDRIYSRAHGLSSAIWVDDSKVITASKAGLARLEAAALWLLSHLGPEGATPKFPATCAEVCAYLQAGGLEDVEWSRWLMSGVGETVSLPRLAEETESFLQAWAAMIPKGSHVFESLGWSLVQGRAVVMGPAQFESRLSRVNSKATVHGAAFGDLMAWAWSKTAPDVEVRVRCDQHGGRRFYSELLYQSLPEVWIERGEESATRSLYTVQDKSRGLKMSVHFTPRADAEDGLVAWASMVSKAVREWWMASFNAYWRHHLPDLKPTAGYPLDAKRFRSAIAARAEALGLAPSLWWRSK